MPGGGPQTLVIEQVTDGLRRVTQRDVIDRNDRNNKHT